MKIESRPLSYMEKFASGWSSPVFHYSLNGNFSADIIIKAMKKVRISIPLLRCTIKEHCFVTFTDEKFCEHPDPLTIIDCNSQKGDIYKIAAEKTWTFMGYNMVPNNLWRMYFYFTENACELIFQFHHALFDGLSAFVVINDFLKACNGEILKMRSFPTPMDQILPEHAEAIKGEESFLLQEWFDCKDSEPLKQPIFTKSVTATLQENILESLKLKGKKHSANIHGALLAAYLYSTDNKLPKLYLDISTRKYCKPPLPMLSIGIYLGQVAWETSYNYEQSFWKNASRMQNEYKALINKGAHLVSEEECLSVSIGPQMLNMTNMPIPELKAGIYSVKYAQMEFALSPTEEIPSYPIVMPIITIGNRCKLRFCYHKNYWTKEQAENAMKKYIKLLIEEGTGKFSSNIEIQHQP